MQIACALLGVAVNFPTVAGVGCAYPWRDGQAEMTWTEIKL